MLRGLSTVAVAAGLAALVAGPAGATKPVGGCPPAFDHQTFEEALVIAHETGVPASDEELLANFASLDKNGDRTLCFADLPDTPGIPSFAVNIIDNTAHVRS
jgi:hypothetical protein